MPGLLERDRFVVSQKAKLIELTNEYAILDEEGNQIGRVVQEGQSKARKALRFLTNVDQFLTTRLSVYDGDGRRLLQLTRPAKLLKSRIEVADDLGAPVGTIAQENVVGKKRFALTGAGGEPLGAILGENWVSWDFRIVDAAGGEVGRINKKWAGLLKEGFTTADKYVVELAPTLQGPARLLAIAGASAVDTALKQDSR